MTGDRWIATAPSGTDSFEFVPYDAPEPGPGEVSVRITTAGVNPADAKHVRRADLSAFPLPIGYEAAGVVTAVGSGGQGTGGQGADGQGTGSTVANGPVRVGDRVVAFRIRGGYATDMTVPGKDVFVLPDTVDDATAAGLLLAGCTAADMLHRADVSPDGCVLVHGASGAVGVLLTQLAVRAGLRVVGTASPKRFDAVREFGGVPVEYGPGLVQRVRDAAPQGVDAAFDLAGTDEAVEVSLDVVEDRSRIITAVARAAAQEHGFVAVSGLAPDSAAYRDSVRGELIDLVASGELTVPIAHTFPLDQAVQALQLVEGGHAGGKVVLTVG